MSHTIDKYKEDMTKVMKMIMPYSDPRDLDKALDYSINKRYMKEDCKIENSYTHKTADMNLLALTDYIMSREPIVTAYGTMFSRKDSDVPNPLARVIDSFLTLRSEHKKMMFKYPKGSEMFERYNLQQSLDKIDANGIYGSLGNSTCLLYNVNVASTITNVGRSAVSSMTLFFESFLANNVKFGSLNEVLTYIMNVCDEKGNRKYNDSLILDHNVSVEECFIKVIMDCGYRWIPSEDEMEIIWQVINNLSTEDCNRVYYKNNLYEFMSNQSMRRSITSIMTSYDIPFLDPNSPPKNVEPMLNELINLLREYVFYDYMYIDRIDRCDNMIKSVTMVSDTDSTIISLDAWYRFVLDEVGVGKLKLPIMKQRVDALKFYDFDEFGDPEKTTLHALRAIDDIESDFDYDFYNDEIIELEHTLNPIEILPQDSVRHTIINTMSYVLTTLVNEYMEKFCENQNTYKRGSNTKCRIWAKNEFTFKRLLMTSAKKSYANIQEVQEGKIVPKDEQLDIKGIASMAKSSMAKSTRDALKKIMLEDILDTPVIDQFRVIKDIAILEKKITDSLYAGSKEYYKPVTVKAMSAYEDPMKMQGIKASVVWDALKDEHVEGLNLEERNAVDIAKVKINKFTLEKIKDKWPETYKKAMKLLEDPIYKGNITSIAIPLDVEVPDWLLELIDYTTIVNNNISGFPYESIGIKRFNKNKVNYTNILSL